MTEKDLKKLKRTELLELLVEEGRIVEQLQKEVTELRAEAEQRRVAIEKAGSIAEASLALTRVFTEAQEASEIYLENIKRRSEEQDRINAKRDEDSQKQAEQLLLKTARKCKELETVTVQKCRQMLDTAAKKAAISLPQDAGKRADSAK